MNFPVARPWPRRHEEMVVILRIAEAINTLRRPAPCHGGRLAVLLRHMHVGEHLRLQPQHAGGGARCGTEDRGRSPCRSAADLDLDFDVAIKIGGEIDASATCRSASSRSSCAVVRTALPRWIAGALHGERALFAPRRRLRMMALIKHERPAGQPTLGSHCATRKSAIVARTARQVVGGSGNHAEGSSVPQKT